MRLFHRTSAADEILRNGFRDGQGSYMTDAILSGVWLSAVPLDFNEGAAGDAVLEVQLPDALALEYEVVEEDKPYREFLIPADVLNRHGQTRLLSEEEVDAVEDPRFPPIYRATDS
jgi:hypothetical protein